MPADTERRLLRRATVAAGTIVGVVTAVPFVTSMVPSQRALSEGAPVDANIGTIAPGDMVSVAWRGKPVWVLHRTPAMIESLQHRIEMLSDPLADTHDRLAWVVNAAGRWRRSARCAKMVLERAREQDMVLRDLVVA